VSTKLLLKSEADFFPWCLESGLTSVPWHNCRLQTLYLGLVSYQANFVVFHGQASVEQGFSVNIETGADNSTGYIFEAKCLVFDHIALVGGICNIDMSIEQQTAVVGMWHHDPTIPKSRCYTTLWFIIYHVHVSDCCCFLSDINISQDSAETRLRDGGIFYYHFTTYLLLSLSVKEFWKSASIWQSYRQKYGGTFFHTLTEWPGFLKAPYSYARYVQ